VVLFKNHRFKRIFIALNTLHNRNPKPIDLQLMHESSSQALSVSCPAFVALLERERASLLDAGGPGAGLADFLPFAAAPDAVYAG
jgi:hypothetical protein